jgi:adenosylhomocysteine nucleosidase
MPTKLPLIYILLFSFLCQRGIAQDLTAIMGAMPEEIAAYQQIIQNKNEINVQGIRFIKGNIKNRNVVLVGSGVGKVNAAMTSTLLLQHFQPDRVLFTGVAGGLSQDMNIGDIVIADSLVQYDFGTMNKDNTISYWGAENPIDHTRNPVFLKSDAQLVAIAKTASTHLQLAPIVINHTSRSPEVKSGIIATGDLFLSSPQKKQEIHKLLKAKAVEMEGGAVAQVCYQHQVPFLVIRSISDLADELADSSFNQFIGIASNNAMHLVQEIIELLPTNSKSPTCCFYKTELYFGLTSQGREISETQWSNFLNQFITPKFPEGLTVINSYGQWYSNKEHRIIREKSKVVTIIHKEGLEAENAINSIIDHYRKQFQQESVLRADSKMEKVDDR